MTADRMLGLDQVESFLTQDRTRTEGRGFDTVLRVHGSTYRDQSTIVIMPSRVPMIHFRVAASLYGMMGPMNQKRAIILCIGDEVGVAYNRMIADILANPEHKQWKYIMTVESDNLPPPDAHKRLLETIESGMWDAVSGLYFTKGEVNMPMAYGDPKAFEETGVLDFTPRDVVHALSAGEVMPVNGIAMGCALWRMDLFRSVPPPWFVTVSEVADGRAMAFTQDLYFCQTARKLGHRFAVDCRVRVGHMDLVTEEIY